MILNTINVYEEKGDYQKYKHPKLKEKDIIQLLFDDTALQLPGYKNIKKGKYIVKSIKSAISMKDRMVYELLKCDNKSKNTFSFNTIAIDKAIELNLINIIL